MTGQIIGVRFFMFKTIRRLILGRKYVEINPKYKYRYLNLLPIGGYIILALTFLDYSFSLLSLQLTNPYSEFEVMGGLIEKIWSPFLGCLLIFYPREIKIKQREKIFLSIVSWLILILGIFYIIMLPLLFFDGRRINQDLQTKFDEQIRQQQIQLQEFEKRINKTPDAQLLQLIKQQQQNGNTPVIGSPAEIRYQLLAGIKANQNQQASEAKIKLNEQQKKVKISSIKWIIGALLSAILLISIWEYSDWTRL